MNLHLISFCIFSILTLTTEQLASDFTPFVPVRNIKSTVHGAFERAEDLRTGCGTCQADVEITPEWTFLTLDGFIFEFSTGDVRRALVYSVKFMFLQRASSEKETRTVRSRVIRQTELHAISW